MAHGRLIHGNGVYCDAQRKMKSVFTEDVGAALTLDKIETRTTHDTTTRHVENEAAARGTVPTVGRGPPLCPVFCIARLRWSVVV
jgi:hypothetical protein